MKGSETKIIKRSSISFNPHNIKNHTDEQVKSQRDNIKRVGFLGGVVWNEKTRNIIDGHRRVQSLDMIKKYNKDDPSTDYDIKVEVVSFDEKTEKEQLAFMALANTKADYNLLATFIDDVDYDAIGLSESEYKQVLDLRDDDMPIEIPEFVMPKNKREEKREEEVTEEEKPPVAEMSKPSFVYNSTEEETEEDSSEEEEKRLLDEEVKRNVTKVNKEYTQEVAEQRTNKLSMLGSIRFSSEEEKERFCNEVFGIPYEFNICIDAKAILDKIDSLTRKLAEK